MKDDSNDTIELLRIIGKSIAMGKFLSPEKLKAIRRKDSINRKGWEFWRSAVSDLSDEEVANVTRGLTFVETQFSWMGGSISGVIWLFSELITRKANPCLVDDLSAWILRNTKNPYNPFGTQISLGAQNYSEYLKLSTARSKQIADCIKEDKKLEAQAAKERAVRSKMAAAGAIARNTAKRDELIETLNALTLREKLYIIANDDLYPPQFYPTNIADAATHDVISELPTDLRVELAHRLKGKRSGPWGSFKRRLFKSLGQVWNKERWNI